MGTEFKVTDKQFTDAKQTFHLYVKKGTEEVATKDLDQLFKAMALHVDDDKLKDWADEMDEDATGYLSWEQFKQLYERKMKEDEEEKELKDVIRVLDKTKKGVIPTDDLRWILKSLATGCLSWEQFKQLYERKMKEDEEEKELKDAFRVLDKTKKGVIPTDDLRWILKSLGDDITEEEIEDMIEATDTDGSGTVDYEEFKSLMSGE